MGLTYVDGVVSSGAGADVPVSFLVDSGATYALLPEPVWKSVGLQPEESLDFTLADGTVVRRSISECRLTLLRRTRHTPVILGEPGDEPLLGAITLAIFGFVLNPFNRTLQPMRMMLA